MSWYIDSYNAFWVFFIPVSSLLLVSIFRYRQEKKRFIKWQLMTIGINTKARYKALKTSNSLLTPLQKRKHFF